MNRPLLVATSMVLVLAACQRAAVVDLTQDEARLRELSGKWVSALAAKDVDTICALFAADAVELQANTPPIVGKDAICAWYRGWLMDPAVTGSFTAEAFDIATSADLACERGTYTFRTQKADTTVEDTGKYLTVWKKVDGEWKVLYDTANTNLPLPAAP